MFKLLLSFLLTGLLVFCFSQTLVPDNRMALLRSYASADVERLQAEKLLLASDDEQTEKRASGFYQQALSAYTSLLPQTQKQKYDSLSFFIHLHCGFIDYYFDSINTAKQHYKEAILLKKMLPFMADSFLFQPLLFTGSIFYTQNEFDSALYYYKKAEEVNSRYTRPLAESQRLFNRLGVMYYQNGNYRQAKNYFEKAISVLSQTDPGNNGFLVNYRINIASLLVKLEEFTEARSVYESILPNEGFKSEIFHNLGIIEEHLGNHQQSIEDLRKVNYGHNRKNADLFYNFAIAFSAMNEPDSAMVYIQKAIAENNQWNGNKKNVPNGLIMKYQADEAAIHENYKAAIPRYQQAIIQFDNDFNTADIYQNPELFSGVFSFINMFNTLAAKADAFEKLYLQDENIQNLKASLNSYESAFKLADYVERTYDSDEARLFLNKIKYTVHSKPIHISVQLYELTHKQQYLEKAYLFDQQNKASILSLNVQENEIRNAMSQSDGSLREESSLRTAITRLSLQAAQVTDSLVLSTIHNTIRDKEIELGRVQEKINANPVWKEKRSAEMIPSVHEVQEKLDNQTTLLSFHLSENELLTLSISRDKFSYHRTAIGERFFASIDAMKNSLQSLSDARYNDSASRALYRWLIAPVSSELSGARRLIIIPDDELNYLPFEALKDSGGKYLIEEFAIQYQYSTALLGKSDIHLKTLQTLAIAPFSTAGHTDSSGEQLSSLPATRQEISGLTGKLLLDSAATKTNFLLAANHYGILHLATHASVNNETPSRSFIAFYPAANRNDFKLYAQEIYDLNLDSTQLVILSACETGAGKLIKGEGLMSLSRAFAYAGCPNIIASLWKAEDKTTAFITQALHHYLDKGYTYDKALQQAKLDLLHDQGIDPRFKAPNYWSHLIFIGQYEPEKSSWGLAWLIPVIAIIFSLLILLFKKRSRRLRQ